MIWRVALVLLQALGAVTILPYPAIVVANIMSIAGEGPRGLKRLRYTLPYLLLSLYPIVWLWLYKRSWREMSAGNASLALELSAIPVVAGMVAATVWKISDRPQREHYAARAQTVRQAVEKANPL